MPRIELAPEVLDDFDRFFEHLAQFDADDGPVRVAQIVEAIQILAGHPLIGRPAGAGKRELVIGRGSHGYLALYRFLPELDMVLILAVRNQREAGYDDHR
jgi:plasmid stabilization system protein ParE